MNNTDFCNACIAVMGLQEYYVPLYYLQVVKGNQNGWSNVSRKSLLCISPTKK